jgi:hypothetical protein
MNVHDAPHRRLGHPCCGAARQPKIPVAARGGGREVGTVKRRPLGARRVAMVRLRRDDRRASARQLRDKEGDAGRRFVDAAYGSCPSCAPELFA